MHIAIDLMGSDRSPSDLFKGVLQAQDKLEKSDRLLILATESVIENLLPSVDSKRIHFFPIIEYIEMHEDPKVAVRRKKMSSMAKGLELLHAKKVDALITAGNTGALVLNCRLHLKLLSDIQLPALLALLPTEKKMMAVLDVGGVVLSNPKAFVQYAEMGSSFVKAFFSIKKPKIGLLNIGIESSKGTQIHKEAFHFLTEQFGKQFKGNIEGKEAFKGIVDVLVTDGFTGNIFLKTAEGVSALMMQTIENIPENIKRKFDYEEYPGAILCGVKGIVIKCHGSSTSKSMYHSILAVKKLVS